MAVYVPTVWVNDTPPPLSAANLNKLTDELQGQAVAKGITNSLPNWTDGVAPAITDAVPWNEIERVTQLVATSLGLTYMPTTWSADWTPARNASRLNAIEQQIGANRAALDAIIPPPPTGTLIANLNLDTGDDSQFSSQYASLAAPDRFRVCTSADGVNARRNYMTRIECRQGEATSWASTLSATLAIKAGLPVGIGQTYLDTYIGWSAYIPSNWPWTSTNMHSIFIEWHGAGGGSGVMSQAPFHWGILGNGANAGKFFIDLHRAVSGYSPLFQPGFESLSDPGVADAWHDYVVRIKWASDASGVLTYWRDGVQLYNYNGPTSPITGERIKFQFGAYVANAAPATKHLYLDELRIGTTRGIVDPANY